MDVSLHTDQQLSQRHYETRRTLSYVENERMGGKIAVWESKRVEVSDVTAKNAVETALGDATNAGSAETQSSSDFAQALVDAGREVHTSSQADVTYSDEDGYGFADMLDIINPLQHIPLVNQLYREVTGDTIKSSSKIVGGVIFTGPLGLVGPLVDLIAEQETGESVSGYMSEALFGASDNAEKQGENESDQLVYSEGNHMRTSARTFEDVLSSYTGPNDDEFQNVLMRYSHLSGA